MSSCERHEPLLTTLADGELGVVAGWRIRRHLSRCARCAALYAEITRVGDAARAFSECTAVPLPADVTAGVHRRLVDRATATPAGGAVEDVTGPVFAPEEVLMTAPAAAYRPIFDMILPPGLRPVAAAAAVLLAAVGIGVNVAGPSKPRVAFADVRRAVEQVGTAHIRIRVLETKEPVQDIDAWLRTDPPGFAMRLPENVRLAGDAQGVTVHTGEPGMGPIRVSDEKITREVITGLLLSPAGLLGDKPGEIGGVPAKWGAGRLVPGPDGRPLLRFEANEEGATSVLWADPETQRPVRVEATTSDGKGDEGPTQVEVTFSYNETPPPGTF